LVEQILGVGVMHVDASLGTYIWTCDYTVGEI